DALRMRGVSDVEQQPEPGARAAGETDVRIHRDVVALVRPGRRTATAAATAACRYRLPATSRRLTADSFRLRTRRTRCTCRTWRTLPRSLAPSPLPPSARRVTLRIAR